jgi:hypothetical protein
MKETSMRLHIHLIALCLLAAPALAAPPFAGKGGTDILHLTLRTELTSSVQGASGSLSAKLRQQGRADVQKLQLELSGLADGADYFLFAVLRDDSEVEVDSFQTQNGEASFKLMHLGHNQAAGKQFPAGLDPLSEVQALEIRDGAGGVLLAADLTAPDKFKYLVKRRLTSSGVDGDAAGLLFMKESNTKAQFRLRAGNLEANMDYALGINCTDAAALACDYAETFPTDADGRLDIEALPDLAPLPFDMTDVSLVFGGEVVLSTELP